MKHRELSAFEDLLAGAAGGVCECLSGHPLDTVKVRMQTGVAGPGATVWGTFRGIAAAEGLRGLYRGVSSPLAGLVLINAAMFSSYEAACAQLGASDADALGMTFAAGCTSGAFTTCVESPVDLVKVQLQRERAGQTRLYSGYFDCVRQIWRVGGARGAFQGASATLLRNVPAQGFHFVAYEATLSALDGRPSDGGSVASWTVLVSGSMAGLTLWISTYPLDVLKSMLQAQPLVRHEREFAGLGDCARQTLLRQGVRGLFAGLSPCVVRSVPSTAACFWGYETAAEMLRSRDG